MAYIYFGDLFQRYILAHDCLHWPGGKYFISVVAIIDLDIILNLASSNKW